MTGPLIVSRPKFLPRLPLTLWTIISPCNIALLPYRTDTPNPNMTVQICCDSYLLRVLWSSHPAAQLVHLHYMSSNTTWKKRCFSTTDGRQKHMHREKKNSDKQGTELNISSPNNAMSNSHLINKTFSISINGDLQKARQARVRNDECTAAECISHCLRAVCAFVCVCVCQLLLPMAE